MNSNSIKIVWRSFATRMVTGFLLPFALISHGQDGNENSISDGILFSEHIRPIFESKCIRCHNSGLFFFGGLRLNSLKGIRKGGHSGPVVVPYHPGKSPLYKSILSGTMPPKGNDPLNRQEIQLIRDWIQQGAR